MNVHPMQTDGEVCFGYQLLVDGDTPSKPVSLDTDGAVCGKVCFVCIHRYIIGIRGGDSRACQSDSGGKCD